MRKRSEGVESPGAYVDDCDAAIVALVLYSLLL